MSTDSRFDWTAGYASRRSPLFARNIVSTSHPLAAQAGLRVMQAGGNAVDAAIATAACMTLVEPCSNGLGSDAFCILWDGRQLHGLNASGPAPAAWTPGFFEGRAMPRRGWGSVTVPGAVGGWVALSERFGRLPFADLMQPAIEIAGRGYAVPPIVQGKWAMAAALQELTTQPGFAQAFLPNGRAPAVGELFRFEAAARSLKLIAASRGEAFYRGEIAQALARFARDTGGALTEADLAGYRPEWVTPLAKDFAGHTLHEIPPNGQGIAAQMALGLLAHCDVTAHAVDSPEAQHLMIEAMKSSAPASKAPIRSASSSRALVSTTTTSPVSAESRSLRQLSSAGPEAAPASISTTEGCSLRASSGARARSVSITVSYRADRSSLSLRAACASSSMMRAFFRTSDMLVSTPSDHCGPLMFDDYYEI